ncbi:hypothetical protein GTO89_14485 [Heliobacterium gestii]|uniref:Uncharacterized protein n=1 Tax=Heliomicrobium gestii TaxID=2699 RepID=A0A845LDG9_HELGE|nr:hypothetical protein [Heliomicrobium gestii]MBM7867972.1 O-antigen/teichoic acid export membrane protein [Heliomicrobium gestii]MZP44238.1 hypothetical protein [Heliomicrobium gestii]
MDKGMLETVWMAIALVGVYFGFGYGFWYWMRADKTVDRQWKEAKQHYKGLFYLGWPLVLIAVLFAGAKSKVAK